MMTVRFATGFSIQYNTATYALRSSEYTDLYEKKDGRWVAQVPNSAVVENVMACRTYHTIPQAPEITGSLDRMGRDIRSLTRKIKKQG